MARWFKNYILPVNSVLAAIGLVLSVLAWGVAYSSSKAWDFYRSVLSPINRSAEGDVNLFLMIAAPILLVSSAWYMGEQIVKRRRFETLIATDKKSDFARNRKDLEDLARDLPDGYRRRIKDKEKSLVGTR